MPEPVFRHSSDFGGDFISVPRASTTVFKKCWPVSLESNAGVNMDAAGEDATFLGLAYTEHESGDTHNVVVALKAVADFDVVSATFDFGDGLKYNAGSATVIYKLEADGAANTIGHANSVETAAVTRLQVRFEVPQLQKLYGVSA